MPDPITRLNAALEGRYRVERQLGEGGMATVYLARDEKHNRNVALKVLKPELAAVVGAERFLAEIETTANLQHPHILPLFDSGEADSFLFYVMPYVEGESLRERLDREHQLPVDEAVAIATKVAGALQAAHERGVVHRDIKPANILLSKGEPLVSDFGIALALGAAGGGRMTETGLSLGTPHYMSPEQATGDLNVGAATDTYALGCVLYEMLVGEPPYTGSTPQAVLGKIVTGEAPSASAERRSVPSNVDAAIRRALEKVPADRFTAAQEFAKALSDSGFRHGERAVARAAQGPWSSLTIALAAIAGLATFTVLALLAFGRAGGGTTQEDVPHWAIPLPDSAVLPLAPVLPLNVARGSLAVSPDGTRLVYVGYDGERVRLYTRPRDSYEVTAIPGTDGAGFPFFSPDGEWIGFFAGGEMHKVSIRGGDPVPIVEAPNPIGAFWTADGSILYAPNEGANIMVVSENGGEARRASEVIQTGLWFFANPTVLPSGRAVLATGRFPSHVVALTIPEGEPRVITPGVSPRYLPTGHLVFARNGSLYAAPFDPDALELLSEPVPVLEGLRQDESMAHFDVASDGTLYFVPGRTANVGVYVWATANGTVDTLDLGVASHQPMAISPEGSRVAALRSDGSAMELWLYDLAQGRTERLAEGLGLAQPLWSPDGSTLVYGAPLAGETEPGQLIRRGIPGLESEVLLEEPGIWPNDWSDDGRFIAYETYGSEDADIWILELDSPSGPEPFAGSPDEEWGPVFSPGADWIAYTSDESGQYEVYLARFPRTQERYRVSTHNDSEEPRWSPDGSEIIYRSGRQWWAVPIELEPTVVLGRPRLVLEGPYLNVPGISWDLHPDGERFLVIDGPRETTVDRIHVIPNWLEELRRLVPVD